MLTRSSDRSRLHRRQCVACGYSGRFVDRVNQAACPRCSCDFAVRPPKSYAEMEGIDELEPRLARATRAGAFDPPQREWRLVERWLVFLFVMSVLVISGLALAIAALPLR
jgi:hypothetical protein